MYRQVMVIDDNPVDRYVAEINIIRNHFAKQVILKDSAESALQYLNEHSNSPAHLPQMIFLDINMPEINGFEFLEAFESLSAEVQKSCIIMMLSSSLDPDDHKRVEENKYVTRFLNKPLNKEKLLELKDLEIVTGISN